MIRPELKLFENPNTHKALYYWAIELPTKRTTYYIAYGPKIKRHDHFAGDKNNKGIIPLTSDDEQSYGTIEHLAQELKQAEKENITPHIHSIEPTHQFLRQEVQTKGTIYGKNYEELFQQDTKWWKFSQNVTERKLTLNFCVLHTLREAISLVNLTFAI